MFIIRRLHDDKAIRRVNSQALAERVMAIYRASGTMVYLETHQSVVLAS